MMGASTFLRFVLAIASVISSSSQPPRLNGIFVALQPETAVWSVEEWATDISSMAAVGIDFFAVKDVALGSPTGLPTPECPLGIFTAYYPSAMAPCVIPSSSYGNQTVANILAGASMAAGNVKVHLGLAQYDQAALDSYYGTPDSYVTRNVELMQQYRILQQEIATELWGLYGDGGAITGIYTNVEQSNGDFWLPYAQSWSVNYLEPLASQVKDLLSSTLEVWASPYYVLNSTRYPDSSGWQQQPRLFAELWARQLVVWAPSLDWFAPQDSMGAHANSFENVTDFLAAFSTALDVENPTACPSSSPSTFAKKLVSNVEIFESWPLDCEWPDDCPGRHPAPFDRIRAQLENECGGPFRCVAWEWYTCLSPNGKTTAWRNETKQNYNDYVAYLTGTNSSN